MVERLVAAPGGFDEDPELVGDLRLVYEVLERLRAQRAVQFLVTDARLAGVMDSDT
jgi:hypothetical protein